jgi:hypothetical protein
VIDEDGDIVRSDEENKASEKKQSLYAEEFNDVI